MELKPGDLVEVVNTPPPGWHFDPRDARLKIGHRGVVVSGPRASMSHTRTEFPFALFDVRFPYATMDLAEPILRKISEPPADVADLEKIPVLTEVWW